MLDKASNYAEEVAPLFKLLQTEGFRLIFVQFNHYWLRERLEEDLELNFPDRPLTVVNAKHAGYRKLMDAYYQMNRGFFLINDFEAVLANPELYTGLNIRRDKLAQYPIAMICFLSPLARADWGKDAMEKMPDLWSFRNLILDLRVEMSPVDSGQGQMPREKTESSSLGGRSNAEKQETLERLIRYTRSVNENEQALLESLYEQIFSLQLDLGLNNDALATINRSIAIQTKDAVDRAEKISKRAFVYFRQEKLELAIIGFKEALETLSSVRPQHPQTALVYDQLAKTYFLAGDMQKALDAFEAASKIYSSLLAESPEDELVLTGYARTLGNLAGYFFVAKDWGQALATADKAISIADGLRRINPDNEQALSELYNSYGTKGNILEEQGKTREAIEAYLHFSSIARQIAELNPSAEKIADHAFAEARLGIVYLSIENYKDALEAFWTSCRIYDQAIDGGLINQSLIQSYGYACSVMSQILYEEGRKEEALGFLGALRATISYHAVSLPAEFVKEAIGQLNSEIQAMLAG